MSLDPDETMDDLESARIALVDKLGLDGTDTLKNQLSALPNKIEPPYDLWNDIFNNLHEIKAKDINEDDSELEIQDVGDIDFKESKEERKRKKREEKKGNKSKGVRSLLVYIYILYYDSHAQKESEFPAQENRLMDYIDYPYHESISVMIL